MNLKIKMTSEIINPGSPLFFFFEPNKAWPIYQNAFASQGSQIRLRDPEDPQELIAEIFLNTLWVMP